MSPFRETISNAIENKRKIGKSSLKTYTSILLTLLKRLGGDDEKTLKFFNNDKKIFKSLEDKTPQTRKTVLSALFVLTEKDKYRKVMIEDCGVVNKKYKEQKKSFKENENGFQKISFKKYNERLEQVQLMFSKKAVLNSKFIVEFFLLAFLGGVSGIAPRRSFGKSAT